MIHKQRGKATRGRWGNLVAACIALLGTAPLMPAQTFGERLGWNPADVVVIVHVDDAGMSHSSNRGVIEAVEEGVATSFSVMMPCPWVPEIAHYLRAHPELDSGLHLTLTSEWRWYRWGPLAGKSQVPTLVDEEGCLWRSVESVAVHATADDVERELRAQIVRAEDLGLPITHLDSHMGTLFARPDFFERYVKLGIEKDVPVLIVSSRAAHLSAAERKVAEKLEGWVEKAWNAGLPVLDDLFTGFTSIDNAKKTESLLKLLKELKPGVTQIIVHASKPTDAFPRITGSSEARHGDLKALTDPRVKQLIQDRGIILTTWKEMKERRRQAAPLE